MTLRCPLPISHKLHLHRNTSILLVILSSALIHTFPDQQQLAKSSGPKMSL
jgi:hypothetical protein